MKRLLLYVAISIAGFKSYAQVKVGDNPNNINQNSLLELESSTKGLLAPRVSLMSINNETPLVAPAPKVCLYITSVIIYQKVSIIGTERHG